jgi:7-carboxy-7-deazaguanine synthase
VNPREVRQAKRLTSLEILREVESHSPSSHGNWSYWIILTGGNPALHYLSPVVSDLRSKHFLIQVETQGTFFRDWLTKVDLVVLSPKGPSSQSQGELDPGFLSLPPTQLALKVVVFTEEDYVYARQLHHLHPGVPFFLSCGTIPERPLGGDRCFDSLGRPDSLATLAQRYRFLAGRTARDPAMEDVRVFPQLQFVAWGHGPGH